MHKRKIYPLLEGGGRGGGGELARFVEGNLPDQNNRYAIFREKALSIPTKTKSEPTTFLFFFFSFPFSWEIIIVS